MGKLLRFFVYVSLFMLISSISNAGEVTPSFPKDDAPQTNYKQKNSPGEKTLDFLLAHHFFDFSQSGDNQSTTQIYKSKNLFTYVSIENSRNIKYYGRLFTLKDVSNLFLFKDSHYIFRLRKIII